MLLYNIRKVNYTISLLLTDLISMNYCIICFTDLFFEIKYFCTTPPGGVSSTKSLKSGYFLNRFIQYCRSLKIRQLRHTIFFSIFLLEGASIQSNLIYCNLLYIIAPSNSMVLFLNYIYIKEHFILYIIFENTCILEQLVLEKFSFKMVLYKFFIDY